MRIADVLRNKGALVATITPETSVAGLLTELTVHNIGAMVVVSPDGLVGIVSERDVVRKLHELGADLLLRPVSDIMTTLVATCTPDRSTGRRPAHSGPPSPLSFACRQACLALDH